MEMREQLQQTLDGAYTLERELGGAGMSQVFVAEERALGRKVVIKVLPAGRTGDVDIERFKREIQVAARLQHAHVVPVLTAGESNGVPFYTMPFVDGESLRSRRAKDGALSTGETVNILRDVARALAYAHERGVVHRDLKPDNVMLAGGSAMVTDFGIAKAISAARTNLPDAAQPTHRRTQAPAGGCRTAGRRGKRHSKQSPSIGRPIACSTAHAMHASSASLLRLAFAFKQSNMTDSAIHYMEQTLDTFYPYRLSDVIDPIILPLFNRWLGELYERKGDRVRAVAHYRKVMDLCKDADPELQAVVAELRSRVRRLSDTEGVPR